ncbi:hypothetical protein [Allokutzneria albata]|uniref:Uncharacterized protein n=1 Tax=Allokutzneria albata TaxID=211114 RepID=A0A1G9RJS9_ALLAB|nr:hypothetical protein [Allokutzneria albata]SDM23579.1 hypothetical protein SAMN04489726_0514 [Allokutzneria albata]
MKRVNIDDTRLSLNTYVDEREEGPQCEWRDNGLLAVLREWSERVCEGITERCSAFHR